MMRSGERKRAPGLRAGLLALLAMAAVAPGGLRAAQAPDGATSASHITVTDATGRVVKIPQPVRRIVSLAPSLTDTLFALGAGDRVVGDTNFCDHPPAAKEKPHVGGPIDPNIEEVAALNPDLVLATEAINRETTVDALARLGFAVYATNPRSVEQVLASTARVAELIGAGDAGRAVVASMRRRLDEVRKRLAGSQPKTVLFVVWQNPLITVGSDTFLADALRWAGARPVISAAQDWPEVSLEKVVQEQPEYLIFAQNGTGDVREQIRALGDLPGWRDLRAVRQGDIIVLSDAINDPSPRLVGAIERLARALHPGRFATDGAARPGSESRAQERQSAARRTP